MKILIASTPATGHLNPLLSIGRILMAEGHEVAGLSANAMRGQIEEIGAEFHPFPPGAADFELRDITAVVPALKHIPPGPEWLRTAMERLFVDTVAPQYKGLQQALRNFPADVVVGDDTFFGVLPMLLGPRSKRPPVVLCGTSILHWRRPDRAPMFRGLPPATTPAQLREYAAIADEHERAVDRPVAHRLNRSLRELGVRPLSLPLFESVVALADAYMQLSVPSFEFPRDIPPTVDFVGTLPIIPNQAPLPDWAHELNGRRKVVLVTQGTVANHDFGLLVAPTLMALGDEPDLLVVVTAGGRPVEDIPCPIPGNARLASYLPFEWILPKTDLLVTNGGYGSVNQAMSYGIPLVTAGLTEDKADVNARVAWSGVGIDLATNQPTPAALQRAVRSVLDTPDYNSRAAAMAEEFAGIDTRSEILRIVGQAADLSAANSLRRDAAIAQLGIFG